MPHNNEDELFVAHPRYRGSAMLHSRSAICPAYCDCEFPKSTAVAGYKGHVPDLVKCRCGEDDPNTHTISWNWHESTESDTQIIGPDVTFHPTYSQGTAIVRGEQPLAANMMHFWEMRVLTALSGTDVVSGKYRL